MDENQITIIGALFGAVLLAFLCNLRRRTWRILQNQNLFRKYVRLFSCNTFIYLSAFLLRLVLLDTKER